MSFAKGCPGGPGRPPDAALRARVAELRQQGLNCREIAERLEHKPTPTAVAAMLRRIDKAACNGK